MSMYLLLVLADILFSSTFIFNQKFQKTRGEGVDSTLLFQIYMSLVTVLVMLALNKLHFRATWFSLVMGTVYAIDITLYIYFSMKAFKTANLSVYSIFAMLGGMILPFFYGTVFRGEEITFMVYEKK